MTKTKNEKASEWFNNFFYVLFGVFLGVFLYQAVLTFGVQSEQTQEDCSEQLISVLEEQGHKGISECYWLEGDLIIKAEELNLKQDLVVEEKQVSCNLFKITKCGIFEEYYEQCYTYLPPFSQHSGFCLCGEGSKDGCMSGQDLMELIDSYEKSVPLDFEGATFEEIDYSESVVVEEKQETEISLGWFMEIIDGNISFGNHCYIKKENCNSLYDYCVEEFVECSKEKQETETGFCEIVCWDRKTVYSAKCPIHLNAAINFCKTGDPVFYVS